MLSCIHYYSEIPNLGIKLFLRNGIKLFLKNSSGIPHNNVSLSLILLLKSVKLQSVLFLQNSGDSMEGAHQLNLKYQDKCMSKISSTQTNFQKPLLGKEMPLNPLGTH